jgi:hypothetical protein
MLVTLGTKYYSHGLQEIPFSLFFNVATTLVKVKCRRNPRELTVQSWRNRYEFEYTAPLIPLGHQDIAICVKSHTVR